MNLHDIVTDLVYSVHFILDAHTAPLLLDHTVDYIMTRSMRPPPHISNQRVRSLLKCSAHETLRSEIWCELSLMECHEELDELLELGTY